jgi:hypothetical protein
MYNEDLYTETIFGIKWRSAVASIEVIAIIIVLLLAAAMFFLYRYSQALKKRKIDEQLRFQVRIKQMGLTASQARIVNRVVAFRALEDPHLIFGSPEVFEQSIGELLNKLKDEIEDGESLARACQDVVIAYERLYHPAQVRRPVEKISDIEEGVMLYFYLRPAVVYVGKLELNGEKEMTLQLFRRLEDLPKLEVDQDYNFFLWRSGDAEYVFTSKLISFAGDAVIVAMPTGFTRGKEVRRPYVDVILPCTLTVSDPSYKGANSEAVAATVLKLNENEAVLRHSAKLDYRFAYSLAFTLEDFKVSALVRVMADKTITEGNVHYQTCKFAEVSEAARAVLYKFVVDRL